MVAGGRPAPPPSLSALLAYYFAAAVFMRIGGDYVLLSMQLISANAALTAMATGSKPTKDIRVPRLSKTWLLSSPNFRQSNATPMQISIRSQRK